LIDAHIAEVRDEVARDTGLSHAEAGRLMAMTTARKAVELGRVSKEMSGAAGARDLETEKIVLEALRQAGIEPPPAPGAGSAPRPPGAVPEPGAAPPPVVVRSRKGPGNIVRYIVRRGGHVVGKVDARLNLDRMLGAVLAMARTDQGEIPFAVDSAGAIHTPRDEDRAVLGTLDLPARAASATPAGGTRAAGDWLIATRQDPSGVTFGIARPVGGPLREIRKAYGLNLALGLAVIAAAFAGIVPLSARMTRNLNTLAGGVERISQGDLGARVPVRSRDEFGKLAQAFNRMAEDLAVHEKSLVERERLRRELELCRQIQSDMLPKSP